MFLFGHSLISSIYMLVAIVVEKECILSHVCNVRLGVALNLQNNTIEFLVSRCVSTLFFVYAAQFLHLCSLKHARCLPLARAELLLISRIQSHTNPKRRDFSMKQPGQTSAREDGAGERKGPKRAAECRLKVPTHIWEHDVGCSSHLTPIRKSRRGNPQRDFSMESCPCSQEGHSSSPGEIRPHLTYPSPETAVRSMRLVWSVL